MAEKNVVKFLFIFSLKIKQRFKLLNDPWAEPF
jgi:hypothetical protein